MENYIKMEKYIKMEQQQQCPICMLYLLPGMNLQDHLDTHPKDMIIKALLSAKTPEPSRSSMSPTPPCGGNEMATVFLTTPYNPPQQAHIYQQQTQALLAKRNGSSNQHSPPAVILGSRQQQPSYRWAIDSPQAVSTPTATSTATFLNNNNNSNNSSPSTSNYVRRTANVDNETAAAAFRCIQQNTEQKNIMIVNTSSTQFSIQQTVPVKKQTATAIELHPVIIENGGGVNSNAISIIPRYTSEKYSGPPPSYESSVTNTNDKQQQQQPRVIDLTQTPTASSSSCSSSSSTSVMKMMEKQNNNKLATLAGNSSNADLLMASTPQKYLEYTQIENGDFMITEKVITPSQHHHHHHHHHHQQPSQSHEGEIESTEVANLKFEEISAHDNDDSNDYNVKFVTMEEEEPITYNMSSNNNNENNDETFKEENADGEEPFEIIDDQDNYSSQSSVATTTTSKKSTGVKVISNVKVTSAEMLSSTIKDIIQQYNTNSNNNNKNNDEKQTEVEMSHIQEKSTSVVNVHESDSEEDEEEQELEEEQEDEDMEELKQEIKEVKVEESSSAAALIQCTETLNLSKDKDEMAIACTSVIRKTNTNPNINNNDNHNNNNSGDAGSSSDKHDSLQPSTSSACINSSTTINNINNNRNKSINFVFNSNLANRLKQKEIYKQPKKLVVKLKKPLSLFEKGETSCAITAKDEQEEKMPIKQEIVQHADDVEMNDGDEKEEKQNEAFDDHHQTENSEEVDIKSLKIEEDNSADQFTVTFLDHHNFEPVSKITVTPEILLHDSETNQSIMSMELEPEAPMQIMKRELIEGDLPIIVKTEMNSCSSMASQNASCSRSSPGPSNLSRVNVESISASLNESSPINFLFQNERVRFSPPLSPYVYMKTSFPSTDDQPKQENDASWNNSNSLVTDQNSSCSRYTPSFDDNRSSYTDLDVNLKTSRADVHIRAPSTDSLNIRTDEKMPARGEISEQESNGEIEQPWHHPYFQLQAYPSSYDMSTAQECWNLTKADSQNACDTNNIQNVIINFSPLNNGLQEDMKAPDLLKTIMQTVAKQEPPGINDEASGSSSSILIAKKIRTFRCPECPKVFTKLRARNHHTDQEHPHLRRIKKNKVAPTATQTSKSESSIFAQAAAAGSSSSAIANWNVATTTTTNTTTNTSQDQDVKVLIKNEPSTSAAVLVKNEMNRMLISTTGSIKMEMDRLLLEPSTSATSQQQMSTLGLKIKRTYMCAKCNQQFRTLKLLDKHFQIHPAECTLCQKTFNSWNTFSLHLKHHLNIRVHACRFCPKRFVQRQRLVEHERIHTGHMPIKCHDCDERFRRYSNMLHHRARVHLNKKVKQEEYVCDCGEILQTRAKLEWHQETHENKPKPCPYCRERFTHRNSLTRHIRLSHTEKYVFMKSKAVDCPICNCTYLPSSIKAHMATHQISNKEFSCTICNKQFSTKWNLKQHHWTHANRSSKPFQCNVCPSAFVRETDYTTHMNAHRSIKPFTCNTCGKRFVRKYNWLRHSREHEREKKFTCEICNKRFHRAYYLTEHRRVHTGERPFTCSICGKTSATKTNHNKHIKIHHARDPLTAEG